MKKIALLPLAALLATTFAAQAETTETENQNLTQNFTYVAGGLQVSTYNHDLPSSWNSTTDSTVGMYLRGSWNFKDNFFVETRGDATVKDDLTVSHSLLGLGYYQPINDNFTVYGLAGFSTIEMKWDINNFGSDINTSVSADDTALTGEIGARYQVMEQWTVEPAVRLAGYDETMYELRLGNNFKVSEHVSVEANLQHRAIDNLKEMSYQIGARYSF
ncbi:porin family protein [Photobacterium sp. SDRW27]|uniref:outer membrane beta-barrel protein n=1 Tax=Photobacterium obscurum TaxID=2829490 RepID=UPI0022437FF6|nr:outer membrane beta-barrel protein [Photobacterium obscurum]MCW8329808.1 porin family protein [Photobacterium obscurum]